MRRHGWMWLLALGAVACGGEDKTETKSDAASDVAGDTASGDVSTDDAADTGTGSEDGAADAGVCGGGASCLNANNVEDLSLCPAPQNEYACVAGCCTKKVVCKADADCAGKSGSVECPDDRFLCGCDLATGACLQYLCAADSDCPAGQLCNDGGCHDKPKVGDTSVILHRKVWIARPGDSGDVVALFGPQARDDKGNVDPVAAFKWKLEADAFKLDGAKLTAGETAGKGTISASIDGGKQSASATVWNLGPLPAGASARVTLVDEDTLAPLTGKAYAVCQPEATTPTTIEADVKEGQATFTFTDGPCDIHLVPDGHDVVSVMRFDVTKGKDLLIASRLRHFAELAYDIDGKPIADQTKLEHGDVISGKVEYNGQGEAGLGITSLGVGSDLLLFNLDAIIGPNVTRPFHPDAPSLVNPKPGSPQDIPGGVTFFLGKKVIESYVLAGPPGQHIVWSLAGRLPLSDLLSQVSSVVDAVKDGLDVGKVVGVLLPYLSGFYSQVLVDVPFGDKSGVQTPASHDLAPKMPLGLITEIDPPTLPTTTEGQWADLMLVIGGAMMPNGTLIPLGLAAGSDTATAEDKADGKVDGDQETPGNQPLELSAAPLHSGLRVGDSNRMIVTAAIIVGGGGKREGGSIVFGDVGAYADSYKPDPFLPFSMASTWTAATRTLNVGAITGSSFFRVVLTGSEGRRWNVLIGSDQAGKDLALPEGKAWGIDPALANTPKRVFVGAFELRGGASDLGKVLQDGTLLDLVARTKRSSFIDSH